MKMNQEILGYDWGEAHELLTTRAIAALPGLQAEMDFDGDHDYIWEHKDEFMANVVRHEKYWKQWDHLLRLDIGRATATVLNRWTDEQVEAAIRRAEDRQYNFEIYEEWGKVLRRRNRKY